MYAGIACEISGCRSLCGNSLPPASPSVTPVWLCNRFWMLAEGEGRFWLFSVFALDWSISRHPGCYLLCATIMPNHCAREATEKLTASFLPEGLQLLNTRYHKDLRIFWNDRFLTWNFGTICLYWIFSFKGLSRNSYLKLTIIKSKMCLPSQHVGLQKPCFSSLSGTLKAVHVMN